MPAGKDPTRPSLREPLGAYGVAIALATVLFWAGSAAGFVQQVMHGAIACAFLLGPRVAARLSGRPFDERAAGITIHPWRTGLRVLGFALLVTWPAFVLGFFLYYGALCSGAGLLRGWTDVTAPMCASWHGWGGFHLRMPDGFVVLLLSQILVVALPEEIFFRGYLMSRFEERWPSQARFLGAAVGWPLLLSSLLFAFGHFVVDLAPARLAVFFPALVFGWMRSRSGSIAPAALFHALCNVLSETLHNGAF
ncbi:MAG: CPBP family intramembrane metalloprotease [Deltaproteobacteria bacterium]|nr:CPBP family intramembrane metalloprotease [Deltaproteobacteria bacterium]